MIDPKGSAIDHRRPGLLTTEGGHTSSTIEAPGAVRHGGNGGGDDTHGQRRRRRARWALVAALAGTGVTLAALAAHRHAAAPATKEAEPPRAESVSLPPAARAANPIATVKAERARLAGDLQVVGSVSVDQDHYAVVGPLVPGRVVKLRASVGDSVRTGQTLAEIDSHEVAQARAAYLSASARYHAAEANLKRERDLAAQRVSSARERELAEAQAVSEAAEMRAALQRLRAFGLGADEEKALADDKQPAGGRVALRAPIAGTVVARTITLGQAVERATDAFKVVDLGHLWVLLDLYEKDLGHVHQGQVAELRTEAFPGQIFRARVAYVNPIIDDKTRTANVRIELDNPDGQLRPGQFVTARLVGDPTHVSHDVLAVPRRAVQAVDGKPLVFVRTPSGFQRRAVELGVSGGDLVEIKEGLAAGDEVAADGAFLLKSELLR